MSTSPPPLPAVDIRRPTWVRYQVLGAACAVAVIIYVHRVGFARALPEVSADLNLSDSQAGWLIAAFLLAYGGFEMPWGWAGDRFGVRHLFPVLVLGWSLMTGCLALTGSFAMLLVLRFLFGFFQAGAFPALSRMMTDWMPSRQRGFAQGSIWMSTRVGGMIIPLVLGPLMLWCGWQRALWIIASLGALWAVLFWPWFRDKPREMASVNEAEQALIASGRAPGHESSHPSVPWGQLLTSRSAWSLCLMYGFGGFAANFYVTFLPKFLKDHRRLPEADVNLLSSLPFMCGAIACLAGGLLSDGIIRWTGNRKWGRRFNGTVGTIIAGFGWLALAHTESTLALAIILCLIFTCNDLAMGPAWACCADIGERHAGTLGGAMNMVGNLAGAVGNLVAGYLFEAHRPELVFTIYAFSFWLGTVCWLNVDATERLHEA